MSGLTVFSGISPQAQAEMHACFQSQEMNFAAREFIMEYASSPQKVGVLLEGYARLYYCDAEGNRSIMEELGQGSVFGEPFLLPIGVQNYYVQACKACRVLFIDYGHLIKRCPNACAHHSQLISNLLQMTAQKLQQQSSRIYMLSQPSIRRKLLSYFDTLSQQKNSDAFTIPVSYVTLAEYLCLDRSAMMRELKKLKDEGIIEKEGRSIRLIR
ncbi:MAG: Crp/Fnr family transcriptional regulator [Clostridiales bacterium]|nr:Crp/Fnr family transcriptional regulator [Clostridiales bacterium]